MQRLIGMGYDAALQPELWADIAPVMAEAFCADSAVLRRSAALPNGLALISASANMSLGTAQAGLAHHWRANDLFSQRASRYGLGHVANTRDLIDNASLRRTAYFHEWLSVLGIDKAVGGVIELPEWGQVVVGVHRAPGTPDFDTVDVERVKAWLPHLRQALSLQARLKQDTQTHWAQEQALNNCGDAMLVIDAELRVLHGNLAAEQALRDAKFLSLVRDRLQVLPPASHAALAKALRHLARGEASAAGLLRLDDGLGGMAVASLSPLSQRLSSGLRQPNLALLHVRQPARQTIHPQNLRSLFGLTAAEARTVAALAEGFSVEDIAARHQVQANTVHIHLKNAFSKTGTRRQAELVALICRACLGL